MEGLFHIAMADGTYHDGEDVFLHRVAEIFELPAGSFKQLKSRFVPDAQRDPFDVLGVDPEMPLDEIRATWRMLVRESHPDRMIARGVPEEAVKLSERRLIDINRAWEEISARENA